MYVSEEGRLARLAAAQLTVGMDILVEDHHFTRLDVVGTSSRRDGEEVKFRTVEESISLRDRRRLRRGGTGFPTSKYLLCTRRIGRACSEQMGFGDFYSRDDCAGGSSASRLVRWASERTAGDCRG